MRRRILSDRPLSTSVRSRCAEVLLFFPTPRFSDFDLPEFPAASSESALDNGSF